MITLLLNDISNITEDPISISFFIREVKSKLSTFQDSNTILNGAYLRPSQSSQDLVSVKKFEFLRPFTILFCFVSAELKTKSLLTTPGNVLPSQNSNVDNILPDLDTKARNIWNLFSLVPS